MRRFFLLWMLAATLLTSACVSGSRPTRIGAAAREFTVQDSERTVSLNQFRGQVVILNFWATWCPPCVEELPSMIAMQDRVRAKGIVVLGVSIDVDDDAYHRFLKLRNVNFLTVRDPEQKVAACTAPPVGPKPTSSIARVCCAGNSSAPSTGIPPKSSTS